jgi:hypothetical protein
LTELAAKVQSEVRKYYLSLLTEYFLLIGKAHSKALAESVIRAPQMEHGNKYKDICVKCTARY